MRARTVAGADGRTWSVRRNIEWKTPATGDEFEHDVDGGRGAVLLILSALFLFWVVLILWTPPLVHVPWYLWLIAVVILAVLPDPLDPAPPVDARRGDQRRLRPRSRALDGDGPRAEPGEGGDAGARPQPAHPRDPGARRQPSAPDQLSGDRAVPELPEVEALAHHLRENAALPARRAGGRRGHERAEDLRPAGVRAARAGSSPVPPGTGSSWPSSSPTGPTHPLHLITHLSRAGWLRWHETAAAAPPKPGRGRSRCGCTSTRVGGPGFDLTEAGTQKRLSVYLVADPQEVPGVARLGPDALVLSRDELAEMLTGRTERIKNLITDQRDDRRDRQRLQRRDPAHREAVAVRRRRPAEARAGRRAARRHGRRARPTPWLARSGRAPRRSRARSAPACGSTPVPGCPARCAGTPSGRCPSPIGRSSTVPAVRPVVGRSPTAGCPAW